MKKITLAVSLLALMLMCFTACSVKDELSNINNDVIDKALTLAEKVSVDDIKQKYVDSGLKEAVDGLVEMVENSYETYDYIVDTSSFKELYNGEDIGEKLSVYIDDSGKVYLLNFIMNNTTVFSGDAAMDFLNLYIEKASGIKLEIEDS